MAPPKLVSSSAKTTDKSADKAARKRGLAVSKSGEDMASRPSCSQPGSMEVVKKRRLKKGFSKRTAFIMACSRRESTTGTYDARLKRYYSWCRERSIDPFTAPVTEIAEFLQNLYDVEKLSPKTIQGYRAAISVIHKEVDGVPIGQNRDLRELILGMSQLKPSKKSLVPNWNLPLVLNSLIKEPFEPMQSADMKFVTLKTVFLLAVASGRRVSEIHALSIDKHHWRRERDGISMITNPEFMAKNESLTNPGKPIFLARFDKFTTVDEDKLMCPCRALEIHIKRTAQLRRSAKQLFLTYKKVKCIKHQKQRWPDGLWKQ